MVRSPSPFLRKDADEKALPKVPFSVPLRTFFKVDASLVSFSRVSVPTISKPKIVLEDTPWSQRPVSTPPLTTSFNQKSSTPLVNYPEL